MQDNQFDEDANEAERNSWLSLKRICKDFLGNHKAAKYLDIVHNLLTSYKAMGCNIRLKIHFLESHLDFFPENLGEVSEETAKDFTEILWLWKSCTMQVDLKNVSRLLLDSERDIPDATYRRMSYTSTV